MQRDRRFTRGFRPVYLDDPPAGDTADPESEVEGEAARGDDLYIRIARRLPELHDGALSVMLLDLRERLVECFQPFVVHKYLSVKL